MNNKPKTADTKSIGYYFAQVGALPEYAVNVPQPIWATLFKEKTWKTEKA